MSKGGLLYHFATKDALIAGLVDYCLLEFEQRIGEQLLTGASDDPRAWLHAYIDAVFVTPTDEAVLTSALLTAVAVNPALIEPMRQRYTVWQAQLDRISMPPTIIDMIRLTLDGLWMSELLRLAELTPNRRASLQSHLHNLLNTP